MLSGERIDTVWVKALPVVPVVEEDDRDTLVSEFLHDVGSLRVSRDIPLHELNTQIIQTLFSEATGKARGGRIDSDH